MGASERDVVGKVRAMTSEAVAKKFNVGNYVHMHPVRLLPTGLGRDVGFSRRVQPVASSPSSSSSSTARAEAGAAMAAEGTAANGSTSLLPPDQDDVIAELMASQSAMAGDDAVADAADVDVDDLF